MTTLAAALSAEDSHTCILAGELRECVTPAACEGERTAEWVRARKRLGLKLGEYRARLERRGGGAGLDGAEGLMERVRGMEEEIRALEGEVEVLEGEVGAWEGLPGDVEGARREVERRGREVEAWKRRRDGLFQRR